MNSYNENLRDTIVTLLDSQEVTLKKIKGEYDASTLSLYYAQGNYITTAEQLELANEVYVLKKEVLVRAITDSDVSTNVLQSATIAKDLVQRTVSNTAVAAANIQIAANSILKLASDIDAIFSVISTADFDSEIYTEASKTYELINKTAYLAENLSEKSMGASASIAEVATVYLESKVSATDTAIKNMLSSVAADFDTANENLITANQSFKNASKTEKGKEGNLEKINAVYDTVATAYTLNNEELNLNLKAVTVKEKIGNDNEYIVTFDPLTSAFPEPVKDLEPYPVDAYYIVLVKSAVKKNFSIQSIDTIITNEEVDRYIKIDAINSTDPFSQLISINDLKDINGDPFQLGESYVVYVYADLSEVYKRLTNVFENYLTAASAPFSITNYLPFAHNIKIDLSPEPSNQQLLHFNVTNPLSSKVAYRCIFLPDDETFTDGLLTIDELESRENKNEKPRFCFNLMIAEHIPAGSYTKVEDKDIEFSSVTNNGVAEQLLEGSLILKESITDNFGNRLLKGNSYTPVIVSVSDDTKAINVTITNTLSDFKNTASFIYKGY